MDAMILSKPLSLCHAVSGLETFSESIFDLLLIQFTQGMNAFKASAACRSEEVLLESPLSSQESRSTSLNNNDTSYSCDEHASVVKEIIALITVCAIKSADCRRILSKPRWTSLLLQLAISKTPLVLEQQQALRILSVLLPRTNLEKYFIKDDDDIDNDNSMGLINELVRYTKK